MNESYKLSVSDDSSAILIASPTLWGTYHALQVYCVIQWKCDVPPCSRPCPSWSASTLKTCNMKSNMPPFRLKIPLDSRYGLTVGSNVSSIVACWLIRRATSSHWMSWRRSFIRWSTSSWTFSTGTLWMTRAFLFNPKWTPCGGTVLTLRLSDIHLYIDELCWWLIEWYSWHREIRFFIGYSCHSRIEHPRSWY